MAAGKTGLKRRQTPSTERTNNHEKKEILKEFIPKKGVRIAKIHIRNFKVLDDLEIEFPLPRMKEDLDVLVMGSSNGLGKTSVLEAISLLFYGAALGRDEFTEMRRPTRENRSVELPELIVRAGSNAATIEGTFHIHGSAAKIKMTANRNGKIEVSGDRDILKKELKPYQMAPPYLNEGFIDKILGFDFNPLLMPHLQYFHSYRKTKEGNPELRDLAGPRRRYRPHDEEISELKINIIHLMMGEKGLFEGVRSMVLEKGLEKLNDLMKKYSGGTIEKLRPVDNSLEIRVRNQEVERSFSWDSLSSGQKEIISTLFLIWQNSQQGAGIVLIDEPELHMNAEWQIGFIHTLQEMAPGNQYIIATHSEDIFGSVDADRRRLLISDKREKR